MCIASEASVSRVYRQAALFFVAHSLTGSKRVVLACNQLFMLVPVVAQCARLWLSGLITVEVNGPDAS